MLTCWKKTIWDSSSPKKERCLKKPFVSASVAALVMMYHLMGFLQAHACPSKHARQDKDL